MAIASSGVADSFTGGLRVADASVCGGEAPVFAETLFAVDDLAFRTTFAFPISRSAQPKATGIRVTTAVPQSNADSGASSYVRRPREPIEAVPSVESLNAASQEPGTWNRCRLGRPPHIVIPFYPPGPLD